MPGAIVRNTILAPTVTLTLTTNRLLSSDVFSGDGEGPTDEGDDVASSEWTIKTSRRGKHAKRSVPLRQPKISPMALRNGKKAGGAGRRETTGAGNQ